jgi:hypothetical protein
MRIRIEKSCGGETWEPIGTADLKNGATWPASLPADMIQLLKSWQEASAPVTNKYKHSSDGCNYHFVAVRTA